MIKITSLKVDFINKIFIYYKNGELFTGEAIGSHNRLIHIKNGKIHKEDGLAIEIGNSSKGEYWLNGYFVCYSTIDNSLYKFELYKRKYKIKVFE